MIAALGRRGFEQGSGMLSPDHRQFILNIPKNASSYLCDWTFRNGWRAQHANDWDDSINELILVLRDPLERWISGLSQYLSTQVLNVTGVYDTQVGPGPYEQRFDAQVFQNGYNQIVERLIFDNLERLDDHVWPQNEIISGVLPGIQRRYFYLDLEFDNKIGSYLDLKRWPDLDRNSGLEDPDKSQLQSFFSTLLQTRPDLHQRVCQRYKADYDLIAEVMA